METDVECRTLRLAAAVVGGPRRLAQRLGVQPPEMLAWLAGSTAPPREVFFKALEVILKDLEARDP